MLRNVSMDEISDGRLYSTNDLVKADTHGCTGCHSCCCHMGNTIVLDPYDIYQLTLNLKTDFYSLINTTLALTVCDGIVLPSIRMNPENDSCSYLDHNGACSIHNFRPGFCRLFPLGRKYEDNSFSYFLLKDQCPKSDLSKIKIKKWIGIADIKKYESYICQWHFFLKEVLMQSDELDEKLLKVLSEYILKTFFAAPYDCSMDFYEQFNNRIEAARKTLL